MDTNILSFLNALFLGRKGKDRKYVYICSPLKADTQFGINLNMRAARVYMAHVTEKMGYGAKAPHAFLPEYLDVKGCGGSADKVMHDMLHPILSLSATQLFDSGYIKPEGGLCFANSKG